MSLHGRKRDWKSASQKRHCPICDAESWCRISSDGELAACRQQSNGAFKTKADKNGAPVYLHRLNGSSDYRDKPVDTHATPEPSATPIARAPADVVDQVYTAFLASLTLSDAHRDGLQQRGFSDEEIDRGWYRSLPVHGRSKKAAALQVRFGNSLFHVPGF